MAGETAIDLDFGSGDRSKWSSFEAAVPSYQWVTETSVKRVATRPTGRFRQRGTDVWSGNNTIRALVNRLDTGETVGQEYWFIGSFFIPNLNSNGATNTIGANLLWELHHPASLYNLASLGVAPFALHAESNGAGNFKLQFRIATGNGVVGSGWSYWEPNIDIPGTNPLPKGQFIDWLVHIIFTEASTGTVEVWVDTTGAAAFSGAANITRTNIPTMPFCNSAGIHNVALYTEMGLYTGGTNLAGGSDPTDIIHDGEFRRLTKSAAIAALTGGGGGGGGGSSGTWGKTTIGGLQVDYGSPFVSVIKAGNIPAGKTYRLSNARAYQRGGINATGSGDVKFLVFTVDTGGAVSAAVVADVGSSLHFVGDASVPANRSPVAGWQSYTLEHSPLDLAGGASGKDVYIGFINQGTGGAAQLYYDHAAAGSENFRNDTRYATIADGNAMGATSTSDASYSTAIDWADVTAAAPANTVAPSIVGTSHLGNTVTADVGLWTNSPTGYTYQWKRDGVNIGGATASSYVIVLADIGHNLTVTVTATNASGSASATSAAVVPTSVAPVNDGPPLISGVGARGQTLTVGQGTWQNSPTGFTYQWARNGADISGATNQSYTLGASDIGMLITARVTATNTAGSTSATSPVIGPIVDIVIGGGAIATPVGSPQTITLPSGVPHFDLPFRYSGSSPAVAEQDSVKDIVNCVEAIVMTGIGERVEVPEFGITPPLFAQQPIDISAILDQVVGLEPRADVVIEQYPSVADRLVAVLVANVTKRET
jgi:hypothetical protein